MSRDLGKEIDLLKEEIEALKQRLPESKKERTGLSSKLEVTEKLSGPEAMKKLGRAKELRELALENGKSGYVSYTGFYRNQSFKEGPGKNVQEALWGSQEVSTDMLLNLDEKKVSLILTSLSNRPRLAILKEILKRPSTAAELVERLGLGTTGQVYHHLKALEAADFITNEGGVFKFRGHRVQSFIMILAGVKDAIDETITKGHLEELEAE